MHRHFIEPLTTTTDDSERFRHGPTGLRPDYDQKVGGSNPSGCASQNPLPQAETPRIRLWGVSLFLATSHEPLTGLSRAAAVRPPLRARHREPPLPLSLRWHRRADTSTDEPARCDPAGRQHHAVEHPSGASSRRGCAAPRADGSLGVLLARRLAGRRPRTSLGWARDRARPSRQSRSCPRQRGTQPTAARASRPDGVGGDGGPRQSRLRVVDNRRRAHRDAALSDGHRSGSAIDTRPGEPKNLRSAQSAGEQPPRVSPWIGVRDGEECPELLRCPGQNLSAVALTLPRRLNVLCGTRAEHARPYAVREDLLERGERVDDRAMPEPTVADASVRPKPLTIAATSSAVMSCTRRSPKRLRSDSYASTGLSATR